MNAEWGRKRVCKGVKLNWSGAEGGVFCHNTFVGGGVATTLCVCCLFDKRGGREKGITLNSGARASRGGQRSGLLLRVHHNRYYLVRLGPKLFHEYGHVVRNHFPQFFIVLVKGSVLFVQ